MRISKMTEAEGTLWVMVLKGFGQDLEVFFPVTTGGLCKRFGGTNVGFYVLLLSNQGMVKNCRLTSNGSILY